MLRLRRAVYAGALTEPEGWEILEILSGRRKAWTAANKTDAEDGEGHAVDMGWDEETRRAARLDWMGRYGLPTGADDTERAN